MWVTVVPIVIGTLDTVSNELVKGLEDLEIRGRVETIQIQHVEIDQNTKKSPGDFLSLRLQRTTIN